MYDKNASKTEKFLDKYFKCYIKHTYVLSNQYKKVLNESELCLIQQFSVTISCLIIMI